MDLLRRDASFYGEKSDRLLDHAQAGALFAAYPDSRALGRRLGEMALKLAEHPGKPLSITPLRELKFALNVRVARHLGLVHGEDALDRFDRVLDVTRGLE